MADDPGVGDHDVDFSGDLLDLLGGLECFVYGFGLFGEFDEVYISFVCE